ncbi:MAG: transcriptional regulator, TetR family [Proteobacteria bacterium]|nr:transcriptional regulator, TetR family [Pseudomonadota bacterium]
MEEVAELQRSRPPHAHKKGRGREGEKFRLVLDTARSVFLEHGYDRASMDMIAQEAGVSKATVYAYFETKQQLLVQLVQEECKSVGPTVLPAVTGPIQDIEASLRDIARNFTSIFLNNRGVEFYRLIISNVNQFPEMAAIFMKAGPGQHRAEIASFFNEAIQQGLLDIVDVDLAVKQFLGLVAADLPIAWMLAIKPPSSEQYETMINSSVRLFLNFYGAKKRGD